MAEGSARCRDLHNMQQSQKVHNHTLGGIRTRIPRIPTP